MRYIPIDYLYLRIELSSFTKNKSKKYLFIFWGGNSKIHVTLIFFYKNIGKVAQPQRS